MTGYHGDVIYKTSLKRPKDGRAQGTARKSRTNGVKKVFEEKESNKTIPPSGINVSMKLQMLKEEGVEFDERGMLIDSGRVLWDGPWKV